jgi:pimeloyl-ACP methyl ester carboxylesterase
VAARRGTRPSGLVMFGGYADFGRTVRFATCGEVPGQTGAWVPSDPLNRPAVFLNIVPFLETPHRAELTAAWMAMVRRTWGRFELKRAGSRWPMASELAAGLPAGARELFLIGCGLRPGGVRLVEQGIERSGGAFAFADPRPALGRVRVPAVIVHGRSDDVVPCTEAADLAAALPAGVRRGPLLTGFYGHTGSERPGARAVAEEVATLGRVLRALAAAPLGVL